MLGTAKGHDEQHVRELSQTTARSRPRVAKPDGQPYKRGCADRRKHQAVRDRAARAFKNRVQRIDAQSLTRENDHQYTERNRYSEDCNGFSRSSPAGEQRWTHSGAAPRTH